MLQFNKPNTEIDAFYSVNPIGEVYVPAEYREAVFARGSVKLFVDQELEHLGRIFTHIQRGGVAIVQGKWSQILTMNEYIQKHKSELTPSNTSRNKKSRSYTQRNNHKQAREAALLKLMCWVNKDGILQVNPNPDIPYLLELIGENPNANEDCPFLVPLVTLQRIQSSLEKTYPINALGNSLVASENVLAPRSQETTECFQEALQGVRKEFVDQKTMIADVGCGSGCLTLLAQQEFGENAEVYTSDILPEATASTRMNIQRIIPNASNIHVMPPGDLFDPFSSHTYDLIIFNAPWVVARVRNRAELAIHDERQQTLTRFFENVKNFLNPNGIILLGYADASGPKAIASLESIIDESGFICNDIFKRRVATHRSKRKWEHIQVYVLIRE